MLDPYFREAHPLKHLKKSLYWMAAEQRVLRDARAVLFTCSEERRLASQSFRPYRCREETVGLGCPSPPLRRDEQIAACHAVWPWMRGEKKSILFLGRLHEKKGCDLLIEAFGKWRREDASSEAWQLILAGPCGEESWLRRLHEMAEALCPPGSVHFPGMVKGDRKWGLLQSADAFILPSHQENFGLAVAEALACGLPVLISDKVNIWREIQDAGAGLVERDDVAGTLALLRGWAAASPALQESMRAAATACFTSRFEAGRAAMEMIRVLRLCGIKDEARAGLRSAPGGDKAQSVLTSPRNGTTRDASPQ
jgi:glycosyltransferase involved in cell wall biosynthesis